MGPSSGRSTPTGAPPTTCRWGRSTCSPTPLLREPLAIEHVKPRLLGHWGTTPGLNLIYAHLNRAIRRRGLDMLYVTGPGHGGPGLVANTWLEGSYTERYPSITRDATGMERLFRQFSFPGGVPSHVAPETPGSIHEGGELGYALTHAYGAVFDNPGLIACCVVGDGEAETGPLAASWHANKFLDPQRDGAVLPVLHLNGYKIANPTVLARIPEDELRALLEGYGHAPRFVTGDDPDAIHQAFATALDGALDEIRTAQEAARERGETSRPRWPMIVLRTPKGWTGPAEVDGLPVEGTWRAHQVPLSGLAANPAHLAMLEAWMRSYRPEELFDEDGRPRPELLDQVPEGTRRMGASPHANGGELLRDLALPDFRDYAVDVPAPGTEVNEATRVLGGFLRDIVRANPETFRAVRARRDRLEPAGRRLRRHRSRVDGRDRAGRRPPRPRRPRDGGAERAPVPGLARGVPADRPARPLLVLRGVHPHHRLDVQPAREVAEGHTRDPVAEADRVAQLPAHLARLAPGPQRVLASGPGLHRPRRQQEGRDHPGLPAAGRQLPALRRRPLPAQPPLRERDRRRQAALARLALDGRGRGSLHPRARHLVVGGQRGAGRGARRRARLRRRRAHAGDRRGGCDPARPAARAAHPRRQRRRPDAPPGRRGASARDAPTPRSTRSSPRTSR